MVDGWARKALWSMGGLGRPCGVCVCNRGTRYKLSPSSPPILLGVTLVNIVPKMPKQSPFSGDNHINPTESVYRTRGYIYGMLDRPRPSPPHTYAQVCSHQRTKPTMAIGNLTIRRSHDKRTVLKTEVVVPLYIRTPISYQIVPHMQVIRYVLVPYIYSAPCM